MYRQTIVGLLPNPTYCSEFKELNKSYNFYKKTETVIKILN